MTMDRYPYRENLPSSVLRDIVDRVAEELAEAKRLETLAELQAKVKDAPPCRLFEKALRSGFGVIAEIKRRSPSMGGMLHNDVAAIARVYGHSEAVKAVSVLTNRPDFGMSLADLGRVREIVRQPILRKDFIFDPYQVWQARAYGADAILLMANLVTTEGLRELWLLAESLGMGVLFECHRQLEINKFPTGAKICGINSRRFVAGKGKSTRTLYGMSRFLKFFGYRQDLTIDRDHFDFVNALPIGCVKVAESGVEPGIVGFLRDHLHFDSMLVGTSILMEKRGVQHAVQAFEREIRSCQFSLPLHPSRGFEHAPA